MLFGLLVSDNVPGAEEEELEMPVFDISRAYFMAPMDREACIELPKEDKLPRGRRCSGLASAVDVRVSHSECKLAERLASYA